MTPNAHSVRPLSAFYCKAVVRSTPNDTFYQASITKLLMDYTIFNYFHIISRYICMFIVSDV